MKGKTDILFSEYIIDGAVMDSTPADMLKECMPEPYWKAFAARWPRPENGDTGEPVIDETADRTPVNFRYDCGREAEYLQKVISDMSSNGSAYPDISPDHPRSATRLAVAECILESLWKEGHFRLGNLDMSAEWIWSTSAVGDMAAFYTSVEAATSYIYDLGVKLTEAGISHRDQVHRAKFGIMGVRDWMPFRSTDSGMIPSADGFPDEDAAGIGGTPEKVWIRDSRKCPGRIVSDGRTAGHAGSRLIYIPFDTCTHRLGGSMLAEALGNGNENGPEIMDPDYFIDCFEVVRELVEDGVVMSGISVGRGGMMTAAARLLGYFRAGEDPDTASRGTDCDGKAGRDMPQATDNDSCNGDIDLDISGIEQAYIETDSIRILFAEIPGVIIQISDDDYDYMDAQFLLQDIAYYPIGRPVPTSGQPHIRLSSSSRTGLSAILAALMDGQSSEGED